MSTIHTAALAVVVADNAFENARLNLRRIGDTIQDLQDEREVYFALFQSTMTALVEAREELARHTGNI